MLHISRWKAALYLSFVLLSFLYALPNALPPNVRAHVPVFNQAANLGLDLQGGSHLELKVALNEVYQQRLQSIEAGLREAFIKAHIGYTGLHTTAPAVNNPDQNSGAVTVAIRDPAQFDQALKIARDQAQPVDTGTIGLGGKPDISVTPTGASGLRIELTEEAKTSLRNQTLGQSIEVVRRRVDETGTKEPLIQRQGSDRIIVEVPGLSDPSQIIRILKQTARLTFQRVDDAVSLSDAQAGHIPPQDQVLPYLKPEGSRTAEVVEKRAVMTGQDLRSARTSTDQMGLPAVAFTLNPRGAKVFGDYTSENIGKRFAIILDNKVISAPYIRSAILGGSGEISGGFASMQEANELKILLNAGALPASLNVVNQRTVGAELGADSIRAGIKAAVIGSIAVVVFMFLAYGTFGAIANLALVANVIIMLGVITMTRTTLTLPGIAGIVLTIGMAVDSNVLIYERIKEELRSGKSMIASLDTGFSRALGTILDANITTCIAALILYFLGAGPVRGFAVAHAIGTLTTIFTAFTLTRLMVVAWFRWTKPKRIPIDPRPREDGKKPFRLIPEFKLPFVKWHYIGFTLSGLAVIASLILPVPAVRGLNFSIDFVGGTLLEVKTHGPADLAKFRQVGNSLGLGEVQVQTFGAPDDISMRFRAQKDASGVATDAEQQIAAAKVKDALAKNFGDQIASTSIQVVGPTVGGELIRGSIIAVLVGVGLMLIYVWFRFEWQFGVGAVVGLFHDILITVGLFALFQWPFDITIIAALLTIVGYSMNDKVVIYDRIRENLRKYKRLELKDLIDQSLNETLSRTTITAVTTLLALGSLYIFGGAVIKTFVLAMILGVFFGTYSSLFISAPFLLYTGVKRDWSRAAPVGAGKPAGSRA
ncbi:MAG TPA: protein translocase subunit SecD [Alphaproteobacteria bacterium]|nr:protein translocase subunit SecD [Alphaproteobacteria bacterium]